MLKIETHQLSKNQIYNRNFAREYGYIYIVSGSIKITLNNRSCVKLSQYHYFLFTPYDFIRLEANLDSEIYVVRYKKSYLVEKGGKNKFIEIFDIDQNNLNDRIYHSNYQNFMFLKLFINRYQYTINNNFKYDDVYLESIANMTLINLENAKQTTEEVKVKARRLSIDAIIIYIRNNINHNFTVKDIADYFEVTSSYLSTFYKKNTGLALSHSIIEYRLNAAVNLIKEGKTVQEVYSMVGFNSYNHFFKQFKEYYHMSPITYVNNLGQENLKE